MSDNFHTKKHRHKNFSGKSFLILPFIFLVGIYAITYFAIGPQNINTMSVVGMFFSDNEKNYSTEYDSIFVPLGDNATVPTVVENNTTYVEKEAVEYPKYSNHFGELIIDDCGIDTKLFFGDGNIALRNGVGIYAGSFIPGYGGTILVAGHNNSYFNGLKFAQPGQRVEIKTSYGNYEYEITETAVKSATDKSAYDLNANYENLIMYTCYPFDELGITSQRFFVYAKLISGTAIQR